MADNLSGESLLFRLFSDFPVQRDDQEVKRPRRSSSHLYFEDFTAAHSIADLRNRYAELGVSFKNEDALLEKISCDWRSALESRLTRIHSEIPLSDQFVRVSVSDRAFSVVGIKHAANPFNLDKDLGSYYENLRKRLATEGKPVFTELGLAGIIGSTAAVDVPDHCVMNPLDAFVLGAALRLGAGIEHEKLLVQKMPRFAPRKGALKLAARLLEKLIEVSGDEEIFCDQWRCNLAPLLREQAAIDRMPHLFFGHASKRLLPEYVDLELKQRGEAPFTDTERRSAFMAEFVRALPTPEASLVCGVAHAAQITYFLRNPINDPEVVSKARQFAALFQKNPTLYRVRCKLEHWETKAWANQGITTINEILRLGDNWLLTDIIEALANRLPEDDRLKRWFR